MFISILERVDILRLEIAIVSTFHIASVHRIIGGKCKIGLFVIYRIRDIIFISQSICYSIVISPHDQPLFSRCQNHLIITILHLKTFINKCRNHLVYKTPANFGLLGIHAP